jgi:hypothetical protein
MPMEKAIEYEHDLQTICFATEDADEGRAAFKEIDLKLLEISLVRNINSQRSRRIEKCIKQRTKQCRRI